jgi:hypothetical protein
MRKENVTREKLDKLLTDQRGKFFSVKFVKKDGTLRMSNGRFGVVKYLNGGINKVTRYDNTYDTTFDVQVMGYRTINLHTIVSVRANKTEYTVVGV